MKIIVITLLFLFSAQVLSGEHERTPLDVVNARMDAYNNHDIDEFLDGYSADIQIFTYPNIPIGKKGKDHLASIFVPMFKEGSVSVEILSQITQGKYVVNHETVTYGDESKKYVSIYEVVDGKIISVQFVRE